MNNFDIVLLRHAQSTWNSMKLQVIEKLKANGISSNYVHDPEYRKIVLFNPQFFDAKLTQKGQQQCKDLNQEILKQFVNNNESQLKKMFEVNVILVSPYHRALETCSLVFNKCSAPVIVEPLLGQIFGYACDIHNDMNNKRKQFKDFDFEKVPKSTKDYYLQILPQKQRELIKTQFQKRDIQDLKSEQEVLLEMMENQAIHESYLMMRERTKKIKEMLKEYRDRYGKVAVVGHSIAFQIMMAKEFRQNGQPAQFIGIQNCKPYFLKMDDLL